MPFLADDQYQWFYWLAPILALSGLGLIVMLAVAFSYHVLTPASLANFRALLTEVRADVIATPHTAGLTPEAAEHQAFDTVNQVKDLIAGRIPPGAVNPEAARRLTRLELS